MAEIEPGPTTTLIQIPTRNHNDLQNLNPAGGAHTLEVGINTEIINVLDYGTDGAAIQAAIDALPVTGGMVFIPEGTYNITTTLLLTKNNITIFGTGTGTILSSSTTDTLNIQASDISIMNIKIITTGTNKEAVYIKGDRIIINNCWIESSTSEAILSVGISNNCRIINNYIKGRWCIEDSTGHELNKSIISDNQLFVKNSGSGILISGSYNTISDNVIDGEATTVNEMIIAGSYNSIISNIIYAHNSSADESIDLTATSANNNVAGNVIYTPSIGIAVQGASNIIADNIVYQPQYYGIENRSLGDRSVISSNKIVNSQQYGLHITADNSIINNNHIYNSTFDGIRIIGVYNTVYGNQVIDSDSGDTDTYDGIRITGDRNLISSNISRTTTGTTKQRYGVNIIEGTKNKIMGNILYQNKTGAILDNGTLTEIDHNQTV